ncbi:hypothetical protein [Candidatus Aquarickettsia rohweri]|uniref:Uncharacterized protein n=1 Tax=Candidatus Aquarickettsia rohweri TaxID=2602574 RepID=A0A3R9XS51_9RICK|nr:hypothetical protein [Candidatus Aquarickettsia rohweri]RST63000.1 hypothetical protein EIC27_05750 [Candidatus Aquarickettsia rohweri]
MNECKTNTSYNTNEQASHSKKSSACDMIRNMEKLANHAWEELFKEKVKKYYEEMIGTQMDENAKIVAEQAISIWNNKMAARESKKEYEYKLFAAMKKSSS